MRELDPPADPAKQRDCMALLECRDRGAHCGLGEVKGLGGARDVLAFGDGLKNPKLLERYLPFLENAASSFLRPPGLGLNVPAVADGGDVKGRDVS